MIGSRNQMARNFLSPEAVPLAKPVGWYPNTLTLTLTLTRTRTRTLTQTQTLALTLTLTIRVFPWCCVR